MNETRQIILRREGAVAHLRFNRPDSLNAIDAGTSQQFLTTVSDIAEDPSVRAVVLSGEGKGFMAGGDLAAMKANPQAIAKEIIEPLHLGSSSSQRRMRPSLRAFTESSRVQE